MGAAIAVRSGIGALVIDARRADGPPAAQHYTFPALVTTDRKIDEQPEVVAAAVRAIVAAQRALKEDPERATGSG
jgi:ABC-type nitrate/sulfonate/bicarbonate transport system substrate-binding protein